MTVSGLFPFIPNSCFCSLTATCEKDGCQQVWSCIFLSSSTVGNCEYLSQWCLPEFHIWFHHPGLGYMLITKPSTTALLGQSGPVGWGLPTWMTWVENEEGWFPKKDQGPVNWRWNGQDSRNNRCSVHYQTWSPFKVPDSSPLSPFSPRQNHLEWATPILLSPSERKYKNLFACHTLSCHMHPEFSQRTWLWVLRLRPRFTSE